MPQAAARKHHKFQSPMVNLRPPKKTPLPVKGTAFTPEPVPGATIHCRSTVGAPPPAEDDSCGALDKSFVSRGPRLTNNDIASLPY